jgi:TldD protein
MTVRSFDPRRYAPLLDKGDFSDVYLEESRSLTIRWEEGRIEEISQLISSGAGFRVLSGEETYYGSFDGSCPISGDGGEILERLGALKEGLAGRLPTRAAVGAPSFSSHAHPVKVQFEDRRLDDKIGWLREAYAAARVSPAIRQISMTYGEKLKKVVCVGSSGDACGEERPYLTFSVSVTASKDGVLQTSHEALGGLVGLELLVGGAPERLAEIVARRALSKLDSPSAPVGEFPVVISSQAGGTLIHEAVGHALEADAVLEGTSPSFRGKVGQVVGPEFLTVVDDPTRAGLRGSFAFDDEGTRSEATVLIDHGVLKTYLFDRRSAAKDKRLSNGHGRRESYVHRPIPRMSNTLVLPGSGDPELILRSMEKGLFVTRMGGGQVNTANGDFVFEVEEGFWVESGRVHHMVRGANLLGNGPEILKRIESLGSDMGYAIGTCGKEGQGVPVADGLPTLKISKVLVGGSSA